MKSQPQKKKRVKKVKQTCWLIFNHPYNERIVRYAPAPRVKLAPEPLCVYDNSEDAKAALKASRLHSATKYKVVECEVTFSLPLQDK